MLTRRVRVGRTYSTGRAPGAYVSAQQHTGHGSSSSESEEEAAGGVVLSATARLSPLVRLEEDVGPLMATRSRGGPGLAFRARLPREEEHSWSDPSVKHNSTHVFYCDWPLHGSVFTE